MDIDKFSVRRDPRGKGLILSASSARSDGNCLDHVIIVSESALYRQVKSFAEYYHRSRTHLSLSKDSPESRLVQPPELGRIVAIPQVGGLRYERRPA